MDLIPYLTFIPQDLDTVARIVPVGTIIPVYYNPQLQGEYRVRLLTTASPAEASRHWGRVVFRYGSMALFTTGLTLFGSLRLRKFALGLA